MAADRCGVRGHDPNMDDTTSCQHRKSDNMLVLRRRSAWLATEIVVDIVRALGVALADIMDRYRFILMMDAAPAHVPNKRAVQACTCAGLHFLCIAASMKACWQPLDTHVFTVYKNHIRNCIEAALVNSESGGIGRLSALEILLNGIRDVFQARTWRCCFCEWFWAAAKACFSLVDRETGL